MIPWVAVACHAAPPAGVHQVGYTVARDGSPLQVRASWPDVSLPEGGAPPAPPPGPLPVIVFSHGLGGSRDAYDPLAQAWAAHGYLVLQPTHPDSLALKSAKDKLQAVRDGTLLDDPAALAAWDDRPREVALVLDHLDDLAALGLDVKRIDREHVGIGGHSFGSHTAALCGGMTLAGRSFAEPRADAIVLLSPQGVGNGITDESYGALRLPTLVVTGTDDESPITHQGVDWRLTAWKTLGAEPRWLLFLDGATHALGGITGLRAKDPALLDAVIEATTAFWDAELRGDGAAKGRLDGGTLAHGGPRVHLSDGMIRP